MIQIPITKGAQAEQPKGEANPPMFEVAYTPQGSQRPGERTKCQKAEQEYDGANALPGSPITHRRPATASTTADEC